MKKYIVTLAKEEREALDALTSKGKHKSQKILNALILLGCDEGEYQMKRSTNEEIACVLNISMRKIDRVKKRFVEEGIEVALNGRKGSRIYAKKADGDFEAHLVALSCSEPPEGFVRWSLRFLADKVVELGYIDSISHEAVRRKSKINQSIDFTLNYDVQRHQSQGLFFISLLTFCTCIILYLYPYPFLKNRN
jgi:hypothetical protein